MLWEGKHIIFIGARHAIVGWVNVSGLHSLMNYLLATNTTRGLMFLVLRTIRNTTRYQNNVVYILFFRTKGKK